MRITGSVWRGAFVGAAVGALVGTMLVASPAAAAPTDGATSRLTAADIALLTTSRLSTGLADTLGARTAGSYQDASGKLVVTVTDSAAADTVRASGAVPKLVTRSGATLAKATSQLQASVTEAGTSWAVDPVTNRVVVSADSSVTGAKLTALKARVAKLGEAARLETVPGTFSTLITGGDAITTGGARCSLGFNVLRGGVAGFVTAGHCTNIGASWSAGGQVIGTRIGSSFPGNDYGFVQYTAGGLNRPGGVNLYNGTIRDISAAGNPVVGQTVGRSGSTTGLHRGQVTALNATVNYPQGQVTGLIRTTVCAQPGDSGGSLFANNVAYGITSGGSGNCSAGGVTFFQPVTEVLAVFGATVY